MSTSIRFLPLPDEVITFMRELHDATCKLQQWDKTAPHVDAKLRDHKQFTPDGRMIGDIGEVLAERFFAIRLQKNQKAGYDAVLERDENIRVEIKITRKKVFQFRKIPDRVIAMVLDETNRRVEVVFNGPGKVLVKQVAALSKPERKEDHYSFKSAVNVNPDHLRKIVECGADQRAPLRPEFKFSA